MVDVKGLESSVKILRIENKRLRGEVQKWKKSFYDLTEKYLYEKPSKRKVPGERRPPETK